MTLACSFLAVHALYGEDMLVSHLNYEVERYHLLGLRDTYKMDII